MSAVHHYSVTRTGPEPLERWFHTFADADSCFAELGAEAGGSVVLGPATYWRRRFNRPDGREVVIALDDRGLVVCDARCGAPD